jgi:succinyl-CoA synthetase beta subunit
VRDWASKLLGHRLVTPQTGPEGRLVRRLYIEEGLDIAKELYLAAILDRDSSRVMLMASAEGGVEIEEVAKTHPEKILKESVHPAAGLRDFQARKLAYGLGLQGAAVKNAVALFKGLYQAFVEKDCSLAEINPLVVTRSGDVLALDGKMNFDSNALYRRPEIVELRDVDEEDPQEIEANDQNISYVKLDGNIGCMVNGAGLAMATMDIIQYYGGMPANFLDVGGGADKERVVTAFKIITSDAAVKGIFVNIFGGIVRCDMLAQGIVAAVGEVGLRVPLVVRLEGTNVAEGKRILNESGLAVIAADSMADGARRIIEAVG